ncbi:hypothetical protein [Ornithinimicrobium kibberense]|uniref:hypothetical protein n=1 Tax=Ornithinimicrobium kibberense TaxID=282060 RepID=UPI00361F6C91
MASETTGARVCGRARRARVRGGEGAGGGAAAGELWTTHRVVRVGGLPSGGEGADRPPRGG